MYSTVLWHMKKEVEVSYLAQEAIAQDRRSPHAWAIMGNCFSLQKVCLPYKVSLLQGLSACLLKMHCVLCFDCQQICLPFCVFTLELLFPFQKACLHYHALLQHRYSGMKTFYLLVQVCSKSSTNYVVSSYACRMVFWDFKRCHQLQCPSRQ